MLLKEVFDQLTYGELSQLALGTGSQGEIEEANYPRVLASVNLGLSALYKRFKLKEGQLTFPLTTEGNVYQIKANDLNKIEKVFTLEGTELSLNDGSDPYSCFTPSINTLSVPLGIVTGSMEVPEKYRTAEIQVIYRAGHPVVSVDDAGFDIETATIELPYSHLEALLYFIASRLHNPIGMVNEFNAGNNWAAKYEMECERLKSQGLEINHEVDSHSRLRSNGWV